MRGQWGGLLGFWLLLAVMGMPAAADTLTGRVVGVHDGDVRREVV